MGVRNILNLILKSTVLNQYYYYIVLFIIFMIDIIKKCAKMSKKFCVGHFSLQNVEISISRLQMISFQLSLKMKQICNTTSKYGIKGLEQNGMKLSINKTKAMVVGNEHKNLIIEIDGRNIQVNNFKYLVVYCQIRMQYKNQK